MGWLVQLAMGVGYWILPRLEGRRPRSWLALAAVIALNLGVALVTLDAGLETGLAATGRGAELAAALAFGVHAWPRVRYGGLVGRVTGKGIVSGSR
jgi:hypothetical protein